MRSRSSPTRRKDGADLARRLHDDLKDAERLKVLLSELADCQPNSGCNEWLGDLRRLGQKFSKVGGPHVILSNQRQKCQEP